MKVISRNNATLLGSALSLPATAILLNDKIKSLQLMGSRLPTLDSHDALFLLRHSLAIPRMVYLLRTSPCFECEELLSLYDGTLRSGLYQILIVDITDIQWLQASLPVAAGGLGVRSVMMLAPSAFLASAAGTASLADKLLPHEDSINKSIWFTNALAHWRKMATNEASLPEKSSYQREWDQKCVAAAGNVVSLACSEPADQARWRAVRRRDASAWLLAAPISSAGLHMSHDVVRIATALRLGASVCELHTCVCGKAVDKRGLHGLSCRRSAGRHSRHSEINNIIFRSLLSCNIPATLEPRGLFRSDGKRPDGQTLVPWARGKCLVWDATVVDTFAPSHLPQTALAVGAAADRAESKKTQKYADICNAYHFVPFAVETLGTIGKEASQLIQQLAYRLKQITQDNRQGSFLRQRLSVAIQRGNALSVLGTLPATVNFEN